MRAQIKLGRIFGIEIGLHYSWIIIALLITFSLAGHFREHNSAWGEGVIWATSVVTALLFFTTIIVHELSHATVAQARGLPVRSITLFALGGVAEIEKDAPDAKTEFWMGIVGPITSLQIGVICLLVSLAFGWRPDGFPATPLLAMLVWLGYINIMLGIFNLVPGFPLDGGRVLRAIVWWITGDATRATSIAARLGQIVAFGFIMLGIFRFFSGAGIDGLWIAFIGWFLLSASRENYAQVAISDTLRGVKVRDVMTQQYPTVDSRTNLQILVDEYFLRTGRRCLFVTQNEQVVGLITPHEVREIERRRWPYTTVEEVMKPLNQLHTITPESSILKALETMGPDNLNQLPVVQNDAFEGVISRAQIVQLLKTRAELGR
jgi:Zn-dependent protease/predicted transcriptional regulator